MGAKAPYLCSTSGMVRWIWSKKKMLLNKSNVPLSAALENAPSELSGNSDQLAQVARHGREERRVETVAISRLKPYPNNARTHSRKQVRQIADSIQQFGFVNPVLVDNNDQIIAGHGRVAAANLLGLAGVPVLRIANLSDAEKRAYILADNRLAEKAGWDKEILAIELQVLTDLDFNVELTGFSTAETDIVLEEAAEAKGAPPAPEDEVPNAPAAAATVSRPGDLWALGAHRLLCGNALDPAAYQALMAGELADMVFTDPPYNVPIDGHVSGHGRLRHREFAMASGEMTEDEFTRFLRTVFGQLANVSQDGSIHFICMDWRHMTEMLTAGRGVYSELKNLVVWNKSNAGMGSFYRSKHELVFVWKAGTAAHVNNFELGQYGRHRTNVWDYAGANTMRAGRLEELSMHPTVKPVAMVAEAIKDCSRRKGIILDPFMGSGTTLIASERTGRRSRGIEFDPGYVDVAVQRWQDFTGRAATLVAAGQTFEEVAEERALNRTEGLNRHSRAAASETEGA
jgi:DNA modification methylase